MHVVLYRGDLEEEDGRCPVQKEDVYMFEQVQVKVEQAERPWPLRKVQSVNVKSVARRFDLQTRDERLLHVPNWEQWMQR